MSAYVDAAVTSAQAFQIKPRLAPPTGTYVWHYMVVE
jgi:hypothetical protein